MEFKELLAKAIAVREKYHQFELKKVGHSWTNREIMEGFVGDVGDLMKFVMSKEGSREISNVDDLLAHELCDCLWCVLILSHKYNIDLEKEFFAKMSELDQKIDTNLAQ